MQSVDFMKLAHVPGRPLDLLTFCGDKGRWPVPCPLSVATFPSGSSVSRPRPASRESSHHCSVLARPRPVSTTLLHLHHPQSTASHCIASPARQPLSRRQARRRLPIAHHVCLPLPRRLRHEEAMALQHAQARRQLVHKRRRLPPARPQVHTARFFPQPCNNSISTRPRIAAHASPFAHARHVVDHGPPRPRYSARPLQT